MEDVMKYIEEEDVKFIRLAFRDAYGIQKNISVLPGEVKKAFEDGAPINARAIAGFTDSPYGVLYLKPEPDTMAILPWRPDSGRVLRILCNVYTPDGREFEADTRTVLKKAVQAAKDAGRLAAQLKQISTDPASRPVLFFFQLARIRQPPHCVSGPDPEIST